MRAVSIGLALLVSAAAVAAGAFMLSQPVAVEASSNPEPRDVAQASAYPVSNADQKADRLSVAMRRIESGLLGEPRPGADIVFQNMASIAIATDAARQTDAFGRKPAAATKPAKRAKASNELLDDAQLIGIKDRLKLTAAQEVHWPAVEAALRDVVRQLYLAQRQNPRGATIDPDSDKVVRLKAAASTLLATLREDQKREIRLLAQMVGLESVVSGL